MDAMNATTPMNMMNVNMMMDAGFTNYTHICNYCNKSFEVYGDLVEHKKGHVGERPFSCHICHKRFTQKAHLNIHKRTHTGEKPYACHVCHKRFAQSSHLNSHRRIHAGDRPYFCVTCNTGFSQKHRFDAHLPCRPHEQSRTTKDRITAAVNAQSMQAAALAMAYGGGGEGGSNHMAHQATEEEVDQKPDIRYLEALNQQALMQQLAEFSSGASTNCDPRQTLASENSKPMHSHNGYEGRQPCESVTPDAGVQTDDIRGTMAMAVPTPTAHGRRKLSFVRHVDTDEGSISNSSFRDDRAEGESNDVNESSVMSDNGVEAESGDDDDDDDDDDDEPRVFFQNGNSAENGPNAPLHSTPTSSNSQSSCNTSTTPSYAYNTRNAASGAMQANQALLPTRITPLRGGNRSSSGRSGQHISLNNFTAEELISHLMNRQDVHRCDFCCLIFQDAAMYHIHRNMHDKNDLRCCNFCGKMLHDKYDFTAHFLNEHQS